MLFRTGERCPRRGTWQWDGYTDGTFAPLPGAEEIEITLTEGQVFPVLTSCGKACFRRLVEAVPVGPGTARVVRAGR